MTKRPNKDAVIKARCDANLKKAVDEVAMFQQLDTADIVRIAVSTYVHKFKASTGEFARG